MKHHHHLEDMDDSSQPQTPRHEDRSRAHPSNGSTGNRNEDRTDGIGTPANTLQDVESNNPAPHCINDAQNEERRTNLQAFNKDEKLQDGLKSKVGVCSARLMDRRINEKLDKRPERLIVETNDQTNEQNPAENSILDHHERFLDCQQSRQAGKQEKVMDDFESLDEAFDQEKDAKQMTPKNDKMVSNLYKNSVNDPTVQDNRIADNQHANSAGVQNHQLEFLDTEHGFVAQHSQINVLNTQHREHATNTSSISGPFVVERIHDGDSIENGMADDHFMARRNDSRDEEIFASAYLPDEPLDETEISKIQETTLQEFLSNVVEVKVTRERTPRERLFLWSILFLVVFAVVVSVIVGVVVGVVVVDDDTAVGNDVCQGAQGPLLNLIVSGSTMEVQTNVTEAPVCDGLMTNGVGLWYFLEGDGSFINATTCSNITDFDTQITVFEGSNCDALRCVAGNDNYCGDQSTVFWESRAGQGYYVLVQGSNPLDRGIFQLSIQRTDHFHLLADEIRNDFDGLEVNPPDTPGSPEHMAALWLAQNDTFRLTVPIRSPKDRLEFQQRYALAVFYWSTNGQSWPDRLNFLTNRSVCEWNDGGNNSNGVMCDNDGVVRKLEFVSPLSPLNGPIPMEIRGLRGLQSLNLESHQLGPSFGAITQLSSLRRLRIKNCRLYETVPAQLGRLTALTSLELIDDPSLEGTIPGQLAQLSLLQTLALATLSLRGTIPAELMNITTLQSLSLSGASLTLGGPIPPNIRQLTHLRFLQLQNNDLTSFPDEIASLSALEELHLESTFYYKVRIPENIGNLSQLRLLHMPRSNLIGTIPATVGALFNLVELDLEVNWLSGSIPSSLANLTSLRQIRLADNNLIGGANDICQLNLTNFSTDCLGRIFPPVEAELICPCCTMCCSAFLGCEDGNGLPPVNDVCEGVGEPLTIGTTTTGSTSRASVDDMNACNGVVNTAAGIWFLAIGNGDNLEVSTCDSPTPYDTQISVYQANDGCSNLTCVDANNDACGDLSRVTWSSVAGERYYILVHGFGSSSGNFKLKLVAAGSA